MRHMRRTLAILALSTLTACASGDGDEASDGGTKKDKNGCALAEKAFVAYDEISQAATDGTGTIGDTSADLKTIKDNMEKVQTIAASELATLARTSAVAAGRMRVALSGSGDSDVAADTTTLKNSIKAASTYCHS